MRNTNKNILSKVLFAVELLSALAFCFLLIKSRFLPTAFWAVIVTVIGIYIIICGILMAKRRAIFVKVIGYILALCMTILCIMGSYCFSILNGTIYSGTDMDEESVIIGVYVRNDDPAQTIQDASDYTFGIMKYAGREYTDSALKDIEKDTGVYPSIAEFDTIDLIPDVLLAQTCQAIVVDESTFDVITDIEEFLDFRQQIRKIAEYKYKQKVQEQNRSIVNSDVFTVFISGIDTYGEISSKSRSDVNIVAVVNQKTRQILLISTPRDYYVPLSISNGAKDKLTHAGIYGVQVSMDTLSALYDTDMDYYLRVNFDGFKDIIDALGGVTVQSDFEFDAGNTHFVAGANELNGEQALTFARERHSFESGDRQRGRNQMSVISGLIQKLQSKELLLNYADVLNSLQGTYQTNVSYDEAAYLVRQQLSVMKGWEVIRYSVDGTDSSAIPYSLSCQAYVMEPNMETVQKATQLIHDMENNKKISISE